MLPRPQSPARELSEGVVDLQEQHVRMTVFVHLHSAQGSF